MEIKVKEHSGLVRASFKDSVDNDCIVQAYTSIVTEEDRLRIGVLIANDDSDSTPMSLSRSDALILLPILAHFAATGKLLYALDDYK